MKLDFFSLVPIKEKKTLIYGNDSDNTIYSHYLSKIINCGFILSSLMKMGIYMKLIKTAYKLVLPDSPCCWTRTKTLLQHMTEGKENMKCI